MEKTKENTQIFNTLGNSFKGSIIIYVGRMNEERKAINHFIEDAISKDIIVICREEGNYILSREVNDPIAFRRAIATYEFLLKNEEEEKIVLELVEKHLEKIQKS